MTSAHRRLLAAAGVVVLAGLVLWAVIATREPDPSDEVGYDEIVQACVDARAASEALDGPYAVMAGTVLDHAVLLTTHAAQRNDLWRATDETVQAFHTAAHGDDPVTTETTRQAAMAACADIPAPDQQ